MRPEWEIPASDFWTRFSADRFNHGLRLPDINAIEVIVPLRDLAVVESLVPMRRNTLAYFISRIRTLDGQPVFENNDIEMLKLDPRLLKIGQKFAYRENYVHLLESVTDIFDEFMITGGLGELGAFFAFGRDENDRKCMALYIPPIVEQHGAELVIMDGIHRDYIIKSTGTVINAVVVKNVTTPFPCSFHSWDELKVIGLEEKPKDINERYFDLNKGLFRDLKFLGIDG